MTYWIILMSDISVLKIKTLINVQDVDTENYIVLPRKSLFYAKDTQE